MGVVRTLLDRNRRIVSEQEDQVKEEEHSRQALARCGYPKWTIDKVKKQMEEKQQQKVTQKRTSRQKDKESKGNVVIPYVEGLSERYARVMKKHVYLTPVSRVISSPQGQTRSEEHS